MMGLTNLDPLGRYLNRLVILATLLFIAIVVGVIIGVR